MLPQGDLFGEFERFRGEEADAFLRDYFRDAAPDLPDRMTLKDDNSGKKLEVYDVDFVEFGATCYFLFKCDALEGMTKYFDTHIVFAEEYLPGAYDLCAVRDLAAIRAVCARLDEATADESGIFDGESLHSEMAYAAEDVPIRLVQRETGAVCFFLQRGFVPFKGRCFSLLELKSIAEDGGSPEEVTETDLVLTELVNPQDDASSFVKVVYDPYLLAEIVAFAEEQAQDILKELEEAEEELGREEENLLDEIKENSEEDEDSEEETDEDSLADDEAAEEEAERPLSEFELGYEDPEGEAEADYEEYETEELSDEELEKMEFSDEGLTPEEEDDFEDGEDDEDNGEDLLDKILLGDRQVTIQDLEGSGKDYRVTVYVAYKDKLYLLLQEQDTDQKFAALVMAADGDFAVTKLTDKRLEIKVMESAARAWSED